MPVVMNLSMKRAGMVFFDRNVIKTNWNRINRDPMQRAGNKVRMIARQSIRRRTRSKKTGLRGKPSPVGQPPRSWAKGSTPPFKMIYNLPHGRMGIGQIVGMVGFTQGGGTPVPGLHEHGGVARRRVFIKQERFVHQDSRKRAGGKYAKRQTRTKVKTMTVRYPKRPFMQPALMEAKSQLPRFWRESITKSRAA